MWIAMFILINLSLLWYISMVFFFLFIFNLHYLVYTKFLLIFKHELKIYLAKSALTVAKIEIKKR